MIKMSNQPGQAQTDSRWEEAEMKAIQVEQFGGPDVLELREVPDPVATDGLVPLEVNAAGINYADTHQAENSYHAPAKLPLIPGAEVVGATPEGERIVALLPAGGGYAERALVDRKSTRLNSSHLVISYAVFCLKKKKIL